MEDMLTFAKGFQDGYFNDEIVCSHYETMKITKCICLITSNEFEIVESLQDFVLRFAAGNHSVY